ncbi:hypothetical protein OIDMADRAFT_180550 [Oidiodendron maius Zn]|uniref:Uncharacterized protein n=1 Tax=Oidiodendron maius (strain Zn) TaxID=913774 RepID=A0A0C3CMS4_OIDMZ|nr:hypothetical protein OIDMADRAFT_180550 [Oidiodendron maius Zn]
MDAHSTRTEHGSNCTSSGSEPSMSLREPSHPSKCCADKYIPDNILAGIPYCTANSEQSVRKHQEPALATLNNLMPAVNNGEKSRD